MAKKLRLIGSILAIGVFSLLFMDIPLPQGLPSRVYLQSGQDTVITSGLPIYATVEPAGSEMDILLNGEPLISRTTVDLSQPISLAATGGNEAVVSFKVAGLTIRNMTLLLDQDRTLIPGGQCIGIAIYTKGALVVDFGEVTDAAGQKHNPGEEAGLEPGDIILAVNGAAVKNIDHLSKTIEGSSGPVKLSVLRDDKTIELTARPTKSGSDGKLRLGLWVKDSTAGIGTMTYTDPENKTFAGLGHAITDLDTQKNLLLKQGAIVPAVVVDVIKGREGEPGELCGMFVQTGNSIGKITKNTDCGLFGKLYREYTSEYYPSGLPIGWQSEVTTGEATILTTVEGQKTEEYSCRIIKVNRQKRPAGKGMVIEITDQRLLEKTNGIVQGMSGSPIIQNGKLIGAVTHVLVNDPHRGYGIFIDWMITQSDNTTD